MNISLSTIELTHHFGNNTALDKVSLSIPSNGVTALLGANGAGKTTLINCALGLIKPSAGSIKLFGMLPGEPNTKQIIGMMLQDSTLPDLLTAREHIQLFQSYYKKPLTLDEVVERCNLASFLDQRYKTLSGGQKRRVQFALAILGKPKIVFLDEPTTGLDIDARKIVWSTIADLADTGTAVVLTTHYLEEADQLAAHTIVMSNGKVIANDTTANIRKAASGAIICCETELSIKEIRSIDYVHEVEKLGANMQIITSNATACLQGLFSLDASLSNLTVSKPSLEDAFVQLNRSETSLEPKGIDHNDTKQERTA